MKAEAYDIKSIASEQELSRVLAWCDTIFPGTSTEARPPWIDYYNRCPELLLYAEQDRRVIGLVFGLAKPNNTCITVAPVAVDASCRRRGVGSALITEVENRARKLGYEAAALGAVREAETFYLRCGYQPHLFIQAQPPVTMADLQALNKQYPVLSAIEAEDGWLRLMLVTPTIDRALQGEYDKRFPGCSTQTVFIKKL